MYQQFLRKFVLNSEDNEVQIDFHQENINDPSMASFLQRFGGMSFNGGLYRTIPLGAVKRWEALVVDAFPPFNKFISCFAYDWLGRIFALDSRRNEEKGGVVIMFEPGTGKSLQIPCNLADFHNHELVEHCNEALAANFYAEWLAAGGQPPKMDQCIGYKIPLFLNGKDIVSNLEIQNLEVYWTVNAQLIRKAKELPRGTALKITG